MKDFSVQKARDYATMAYLAFKDEKKIGEGIRPLGFELFYFFDKNDIQGYIAEGIDSIVVVFRGTNSEKDLLTDLNIILTPYPKTRRPICKPKVHTGFLEGFLDIRGLLFRKIEELMAAKNSVKEMAVIGYSMGAGIGAIAAMEIKRKYHLPTYFTAFGMPRTGNKQFAKKFNKTIDNSHVLLNDVDPVGKVPPKSFGYRHVKNYVLIDNNEKIIMNPNWFEKLEATIESVIEFLESVSLDSHMITTYIETLEKLVKKKENK